MQHSFNRIRTNAVGSSHATCSIPTTTYTMQEPVHGPVCARVRAHAVPFSSSLKLTNAHEEPPVPLFALGFVRGS
jgi:hypothetical protein